MTTLASLASTPSTTIPPTLPSTPSKSAVPRPTNKPHSAQNVLYWGQRPQQEANLRKYCNKPDEGVDIIILGFLYNFGRGSNPWGGFGLHCNTKSNGESEQCEELKTDIKECQSKGVKVMLSLGGAIGQYSIENKEEAERMGQYLWDAYGKVTTEAKGKVHRPFGDIFVNGFDFDIETAQGNGKIYYRDMIQKLRDNFPSGEEFVISGAPQCALPEANMHGMIKNAKFDYLFVQFYNTEFCSGLASGTRTGTINYMEWKRSLQNTASANARIFLGVPAAPLAANGNESGAKYYMSPTELLSITKKFQGDDAFGGIMTWAAGWSDSNHVNGRTYAKQAKCILERGGLCSES